MKRTYVFYRVFIAAALVGICMILGAAGSSDLGILSFGEILGLGTAGLCLSVIGVRGSRLCGNALRRNRYIPRRRAMRAVSGGGPKKAA